jgi:Coenzyme PQQ synthesis protein D (PqqD)
MLTKQGFRRTEFRRRPQYARPGWRHCPGYSARPDVNLNFVGSRILELLETGATESAIVDEISQKFEVSRDVAESDVREFIESLKLQHLLEGTGTNGKH